MSQRAVEKSGAGVLLACWECRAALAGVPPAANHFCDQCGKVQPLAGQADYFSFFGLPRRLGLDPAELEKQFHDLSWKLHPDRFHQASDYERVGPTEGYVLWTRSDRGQAAFWKIDPSSLGALPTLPIQDTAYISSQSGLGSPWQATGLAR